jgi:hypothetical protein
VRNNDGGRAGPSLRRLGAAAPVRTLAVGHGWRIVGVCRGAR